MPIAAALPYISTAAAVLWRGELEPGHQWSQHRRRRSRSCRRQSRRNRNRHGHAAVADASQCRTGRRRVYRPTTGQGYDFRGKFDPVKFFKENPSAWQIYLDEATATGNPPREDIEGFAKDYLGSVGIQGPAQQRN